MESLDIPPAVKDLTLTPRASGPAKDLSDPENLPTSPCITNPSPMAARGPGTNQIVKDIELTRMALSEGRRPTAGEEIG